MKISLLGSLNDLTSNIISKSLSCPVRNVPDEIGLATGVACQHVDGRLNDGFGGGSLTTVMSSGRSMMLVDSQLCSCLQPSYVFTANPLSPLSAAADGLSAFH